MKLTSIELFLGCDGVPENILYPDVLGADPEFKRCGMSTDHCDARCGDYFVGEEKIKEVLRKLGYDEILPKGIEALNIAHAVIHALCEEDYEQGLVSPCPRGGKRWLRGSSSIPHFEE